MNNKKVIEGLVDIYGHECVKFIYHDFDDLNRMHTGQILYDNLWETFTFTVKRGPNSLCCYIGVTDLYPFYGEKDSYNSNWYEYIRVHGGITYEQMEHRCPPMRVIPKGEISIEDDVILNRWWTIGWDYSHSMTDKLFRFGDEKIDVMFNNIFNSDILGQKFEWTLMAVLLDNMNVVNYMIKMNKILIDKTKNLALLNVKSEDVLVREICKRKLKGKI